MGGGFVWRETKDERIKMVGEIYFARFSCKGVRIQESLYTKNFKIAVQMVDEIQKTILLGDDWKKEKALFGPAWQKFVEDKAQGKIRGNKVTRPRDKTIREYVNFGELYFLPFLSKYRVDKIDQDVWDKYIEWVQKWEPEKVKAKDGSEIIRRVKERSAPVLIFNHWKYLHAFFSWAKKKEMIRRFPEIYNPDSDLDTDEDGAGKNFTDDELRVMRVESKKIPRMHLWIMMGQYMAMRSSEITQLHKSRIDLASGLIRLRKKDVKTNEPREVPIHPKVRPLLIEQMKGDSPYLFPNAWDKSRPMDPTGFKKPWTKLREDCGIEGRFHDIRHSYCTRIFANPDVNPVLVCKAIGMSMRVAMSVYIHFDEKHLAKVTSAVDLGAE